MSRGYLSKGLAPSSSATTELLNSLSDLRRTLILCCPQGFILLNLLSALRRALKYDQYASFRREAVRGEAAMSKAFSAWAKGIGISSAHASCQFFLEMLG